MAHLQFTGVNLAFGGRDIVKNGCLFLKDGSKAALCGANGSGKSSLLKMLAGVLEADSGERVLEKNARLSYLPQSGVQYRGRTLFEEAETAFDSIKTMLDEAARLGAELAACAEEDAKTAALLEAQHTLMTHVEESGYYFRAKKIAQTLTGLGFSEADFEKPCAAFSGGWQMRIALAKVLLESPDILLLDEPTNYLDIEARFWLEEYLAKYKGAYMLVSHDRYFLDRTVSEVYELFQSKLTRYAGNYSAYQTVRESEIKTLIERYRAQAEYIQKTEQLINRFRYKASKAAMAQELVRKLEKLERIELPETLKKIEIVLPPPPHSGAVALSLRGVGKSYGSHRVLDNIELDIDRSERLLVAGKNGSGKTTLLRLIAGAADTDEYEGEVRYGAGVSAGYYNQDAAETINGTQTVLEYLEARAPFELVPKARDMLGAFLFRGDDVHKPLNVLSGGEKSRLSLLALLLRPVNLLVLDEPTNHLDLDAKDILLDALRNWTGTIIFVSHDHAFMNALAAKTLELREGAHHKLYYGNYEYYLEKTREEDAALPCAAPSAPAASTLSSAALAREERKSRQAQERRREREETAVMAEIEKLEARKAEIEHQLTLREVWSSGEKMKAAAAALADIQLRLDDAENRWNALSG